MYTVGRLSSYISQGVYTFSGPFHPFGGAVDIVVVQQEDGTFKSTPWYVKFGKFQGVLKRKEKTVAISVNDVDAKFHMYLDHKGEAYFLEDDEKQAFSPPSGPSSGDEAGGQETLALEYDKTEATADGNDSGASDDEREELQFTGEESGSRIQDLLNEAVGVGEGSDSTSASALFANSALMSIQRVAETPKSEETTVRITRQASVVEVIEAQTREEEASSTATVEQVEAEAKLSVEPAAVNGEYLVNSYEVAQVVDNSYVLEARTDDEQIAIQEVDKQDTTDQQAAAVEETDVENPIVAVPDEETKVNMAEAKVSVVEREVKVSTEEPKLDAEQENAWTDVITKAAAVLREAPDTQGQSEKKLETLENVERRTWGWWIWRGGDSSKPNTQSPVKNNVKKIGKQQENGQVDKAVVADNKQSNKTRNSSVLGLMFGSGREQQQQLRVHQNMSAETVVELLESKWTVGNGIKSEGLIEDQQEADREVMEDAGERPITNEVDLSSAEVVLLSVDGRMVVAKQDESSDTSDQERQENEEWSPGSAPIKVPGKRILEPEEGTDLKVGSESTLDTSPHRKDYGRMSSSLSSYFETKSSMEGTSTSADDAANVSQDVDEGVDRASMDVQVGSPWSTVSIPAAAPIEDSDLSRNEEVTKEVEAVTSKISNSTGFELSLCRHLLTEGMGVEAAAKAFNENKVSVNSFKSSPSSVLENDSLVVRVGGKYYPSTVAASIVFGLLAFGQVIMPKHGEPIKVEASEKQMDMVVKSATETRPSTGGWRFWPFALRREKSSDATLQKVPGDALLAATEVALNSSMATGIIPNGYYRNAWKLRQVRTLIPTSEQLASLNLRPGRNKITFTFTTRVLGKQQVDARIYLWKWNAKIVISDVDGTITKSDVLGQVMPLVGRDWTQIGVTRLFSAIKDNGYELMFLSARAIAQAYLTRQFLVNLKQDGEFLPDGPVVISPDGLFPSLYREVIRRAPHEFKIACLEDIKSLFPPECQPFYAGFGNRDTDEISYLKVGIPKGKIFIINPKGDIIVNNFLDMKSYTSLHKLVNDMFPPVNLTEREDFNSWNFWKMPLPDVEDV